MTKFKDKLWVEKYRPKTINDVVFQDERQKKYFAGITAAGDISQHLLLQGMRGTGKSTISQSLINDLGVHPGDVLTLKCSNEKIDGLRDKVENFAMTFPLGQFKVVRLEELDFMSLSGQALLRSLIEDTSMSCRYIVTCNYVNRIMPELRSRFNEISFRAPDKDGVVLRMAEILEAEQVAFTPEDLVEYVTVGYPDIRKTIQLLQGNVEGKALLPPSGIKAQEADWKFGLLALLRVGNFIDARKLVCTSATREEHEDVFRFLYENVGEFKLANKDEAVITIAEHLYRHHVIADTEINLAAMFIALSRC